MNKTRNLAYWMYKRGYFTTSDVLAWGVDNYTNTAERKARLFREQGLLQRVDKPDSKEKAYKVNTEEMEKYLQK